jgi:hypothetical protein
MRGFVIGLVLLFAVFTFVGAMNQPGPATAQAAAELPSVR